MQFASRYFLLHEVFLLAYPNLIEFVADNKLNLPLFVLTSMMLENFVNFRVNGTPELSLLARGLGTGFGSRTFDSVSCISTRRALSSNFFNSE